MEITPTLALLPLTNVCVGEAPVDKLKFNSEVEVLSNTVPAPKDPAVPPLPICNWALLIVVPPVYELVPVRIRGLLFATPVVVKTLAPPLSVMSPAMVTVPDELMLFKFVEVPANKMLRFLAMVMSELCPVKVKLPGPLSVRLTVGLEGTAPRLLSLLM